MSQPGQNQPCQQSSKQTGFLQGKDIQNCISTLPTNLCIRQTAGVFEVWSVKDIPIGTMFGPYHGVFIDCNKQNKRKGYQWQVSTKENKKMILDGSNETDSNWLRYVNYACSRVWQNLFAVQHKLNMYYVTCKPIPANTELLVWYWEDFPEKRSNQRKGYISGNSSRSKDSNQKSRDFAKCENKFRKCIKEKWNETNLGPQCTNENDESEKKLITQNVMHKSIGCCKRNYNLHEGKLKKDKKHQEEAYRCNICLRNFIQRSQQVVHERIHTGEKRYKCNICRKSFSVKSSLAVHQRIHNGEKPYKCNICGKAFSVKSNLAMHQRIHTGEKPYKCNICRKAFSVNSSLRVHQRIHTGEKPYKCNICGKVYAVKCNLARHQKIHSGKKLYKCNICLKNFSKRSHLLYHERIHTGERPYKCNVCGKAFTLKSDLTKHQKSHSGKKPYKCNICEKAFALKSNLAKHQRIHTGKSP